MGRILVSNKKGFEVKDSKLSLKFLEKLVDGEITYARITSLDVIVFNSSIKEKKQYNEVASLLVGFSVYGNAVVFKDSIL